MDLRTGYLQLQSSQGQVARNYFFVKTKMVDCYRYKEVNFYQVYSDTKVPNKYPAVFFLVEINILE